MRLLKCLQTVAIVLILLITAEFNLQAYEPMPKETIFEISDRSDAFLYGEVQSKAHFFSEEGRPRTLYTIKVFDIFFDKVGITSGNEEIEVVTNEGPISGPDGAVEVFKDLNTPTLSVNGFYLLYLRWDSVQNGFILTSGETSLFEVDDQGKVLNFDGVYFLDLKDGKPVFGMPRASKIMELMEKEKDREPLPSAIVTDIYGNTQVIEPSPKWFQEQEAQDLSTDLYLSLEEFLEKVKEKEGEK